MRVTSKELKKMKHKIIKAQIKEDLVAVTWVEMLDGSMKICEGMTMMLVERNRQHFQISIRNGGTAANGEAFSKGLRPHETSNEELHKNTRAILEDTLDFVCCTVVEVTELTYPSQPKAMRLRLSDRLAWSCKLNLLLLMGRSAAGSGVVCVLL